MLSPICWNEGRVRIIDQTRLPTEERWVDLERVEDVAEAIRTLAVRGAPAIGIAAAMGCALAAAKHEGDEPEALAEAVRRAAKELAGTRPTAVNLFWALNRIRERLDRSLAASISAAAIRDALLAEAQAIREEDIAACRAIGSLGAALLPDKCTVITHCNAGSLATGGHGTALGVIRSAIERGKQVRVLADETRPLLQGARLTTWELMRDGIDVTLICDAMAGHAMRLGMAQACIVGADRIAANGDTANKIGTYSLAVLARRHGLPFYVAAPFSTVDLSLADGHAIPIEQRAAEEVASPRGTAFAPEGVEVFNPAFDVTPAVLISAIVTDRGVVRSPGLREGLLGLSRAE
ncbi:MAG: S-methyl-5-thioribose-1-phosphate isomerase [Deltaproteobacteria bacterium]|nr:S-methyl-5-thioribose-1-phosphate isomerase [Deltaproteobacteria bacterium]